MMSYKIVTECPPHAMNHADLYRKKDDGKRPRPPECSS